MKKQSHALEEFSILIPAHNEEESIGVVLEAALSTSAHEVIVVDDGSVDGTVSVVEKYQKKDSRIRLISHSSNKGPGQARKTAIVSSRTEVLLFFDADVLTATGVQMRAIVDPVLTEKADVVFAGFDNFGRVTEFLARPLLRQFVPALASLSQPLSGLFATKKNFLRLESIASGHAVSGILLDAYFAGARITDVSIGSIIHDKRSDEAKRAQALTECEVFFKKLEEYGVITTRPIRLPIC